MHTTTDVTVQVRQDVAAALHHHRRKNRAARELMAAAEELGVELKPMHPETLDPALSRYFAVQLDDATTTGQVLTCLRNCAAVEAAYVKPIDELP